MGAGTSPYRLGYKYEKIGDEGLEGCTFADLIMVHGPCGQEHAMSKRAAGQLRDWLDEKLGGPPTINGSVKDLEALMRRAFPDTANQ